MISSPFLARKGEGGWSREFFNTLLERGPFNIVLPLVRKAQTGSGRPAVKVAPRLDKTQVQQFYMQMALVRRFEEEAGQLYMQGKIRGFLHLYIGQEAVAVGAISALGPKDYVVTHYRDHGHALVRGLPPRAIMAELMGKVTGCSGGRGGSMHLFDVSKGFWGGYAIVGGQMPIAVGLGLATRYKGERRVVLCFFGDGAVHEGEYHESLNLASLWKLPVLFFLENNLYGMGSHVKRAHAAGRDLYLMAEAYKIPAVQVDGMDLMAVREATMEAVDRIRSGGGPLFLEAMTYRFRGHSMADPVTYRDAAEVEEWRRRDPIELFRERMSEEGLLSPEEAGRIETEVEAIVEDAVRFAEDSPDPPLESLYDHLYA